MNLRTAATALATIALLALPAAATAGKGQKSPVREFTGTVSVAKGKSFTLRRGDRAAVKIKLTRKTRVAKGAQPRRGLKLMVKARRGKNRWVARSVKLVPVVADKDDGFSDLDPLEDEPVAEDDEPDESEPAPDLEETFGELLPEEGEEPEE